MKWAGKLLLAALALAALAGAFYAGRYIEAQEQTAKENARCRQYILFAMDKAQNKDLSDDMVMEALISNVYAAHESCRDVEMSAELSDLWNTLMLRGEEILGHEEMLVRHLRGILQGME